MNVFLLFLDDLRVIKVVTARQYNLIRNRMKKEKEGEEETRKKNESHMNQQPKRASVGLCLWELWVSN